MKKRPKMPAPCTLLVTQAPGSTRQIKSEEARYNTWTQYHSHYPKDEKWASTVG